MRFLLLACCMLLSSWAVAQDVSGLSEYQQGAGDYFAGRTQQAEEHLSAAIESDPNDIRAYYLRGLNRMSSGDLPGAQADLAKGAELEAQRGYSPLVDQSLASVQGSARVTLERIRRAARRSAELQERRAIMQARKQHREQQEQRVLRTDYQLPIEALANRLTVEQARQVANKLGPESQQPAPTAIADSNDPFADDTGAAPVAANSDVPATAPAVASADVPEAARGSVEASDMMDIVGEVIGQALADRASVFTGVLPPMPMGPPPGMMGGGGMEEFGGPGGGQGFPAGAEGFPAGAEGFPAGGEGFPAGAPDGMNSFEEAEFDDGANPFMESDGGNPFEDAPADENPFDFGE